MALAERIAISRYSYAHCGGEAAVLKCACAEELENAAAALLKDGVPFRVLGGLSNVLVSDAGWQGVILLNRGGEMDVRPEQDGSMILSADSGMNMASIVSYCEKNDLTGLEWAAGLPGTLGGAVYGNAGAFGGNIAGNFVSACALDEKGNRVRFTQKDMDFQYRSSVLKRGNQKAVLLNCVLSVRVSDKKGSVKEEGDTNRKKRHDSQPYGVGSLGSVFRNPEGDSAGRLIELAGLKGKRVGKAEISTKHANFIVTEPGVRSADYRELLDMARNAVWEQFQIQLVPEIELIGF